MKNAEKQKQTPLIEQNQIIMAEIFEDNPNKVLDRVIDISSATLSPEDLQSQIKDVVLHILSTNDENPELLSTDTQLIHSKQLHGGITNQLYHISIDRSVKSSFHNFIFRIYGNNTEQFIDRNIENLVFARFSALSFGPKFCGLFKSGRVEGYIPARALEPDEMSDSFFYPHISGKVAQLHQLSIVEIKPEVPYSWLWKKIHLFFQLASCVEGESFSINAEKQSQYEALGLNAMLQEFFRLQSSIEQYHKELLQTQSNEITRTDEEAERAAGRSLALDEVLCHNDLLSGNILYTSNINEQQETSQKLDMNPITLIDYEYAAYNYRAYDFANHFCGKQMACFAFPSFLITLHYFALYCIYVPIYHRICRI